MSPFTRRRVTRPALLVAVSLVLLAGCSTPSTSAPTTPDTTQAPTSTSTSTASLRNPSPMTALPRFDSGVLMDRGVVWGIAGRDLVANLDAGASAWITYPLPDNVTTALSLDDNVLLGSAVAPDGTAAITIRGPQRSVVYYSRG